MGIRCFMCKKYLVILFFYLFSHCSASAASVESLKVIFVNPGHSDKNTTGSFWANVSLFMQSAADDLNIELITIYGERNHVLTKSLADEVVTHSPDYVILVNEKGTGLNLVKALAPYHIPIFMLLNTFNTQEMATLSSVEKATLIGSLIPNNKAAGENLANDLFNLYLKNDPIRNIKKQINLLALQGDYKTPAAMHRAAGLENFLRKNAIVTTVDSTVANWSKQQAYRKVRGILQRKHIDIIWAANDAMAYGAKQAVKEADLNYRVVIGGVNWDIDEPLTTIDVSYGGHVTLGAFALVMLHDIERKLIIPRKKHRVVDIFESSQGAYYLPFKQNLIKQTLADYDFFDFSEEHETSYLFSLKNLLNTRSQADPQIKTVK